MQLQCTLAGANFRPAEAKDILKSLSPGDRLTLRADFDNRFDENAVAVDYYDVHLGFVPKDSNGALADALREGAEPTCEIIAFESTLKPVLEIIWDESLDYRSEQDEGEW